MKNIFPTKKKSSGLFLYISILTSFFFLLEVSYFIQCNRAYFADFTFVTDNLKIPATVIPGILGLIAGQLFIHFIYCIVIWGITNCIALLFPFVLENKLKYGISLWVLGIITIIFSNQYFFPNSKFAELSTLFISNQLVTKILLWILYSISISILIFTSIGLILFFRKKIFLLFPIFFLVFIFNFYQQKISPPHDAGTMEKPNIFIIGVDSLRPDFTSFLGAPNKTPFIDSLLSTATTFTEALTPLARTFPSWTSILTGKYPRETGIRFNLAEQTRVDFSDSLPAILRRNGYQTFYASDETRFSNVDTNLGFDKIITPPIGLNDFLVGTFNDFPLSNFLVNTSIGRILFPYNYGNRPVFFTYQPNSFLNLIKPFISQNRNKPLFMAVHFCLPHFPYLWADIRGNDLSIIERYSASIIKVDEQLKNYFQLLKENNLLNHAIVIFLSDHGEALELEGDRLTEADAFIHSSKTSTIPHFYPPSLDGEEVNQSAGHGTDVLGLSQYHALLAFKLYGLDKQYKGLINQIVSLIDIKPTILHLLSIQNKNSAGINLSDGILYGKKNLQMNHIFLESDFSPEAIRTIYPETRKVLLEGITLFKVDPLNTRLIVKDTMGQMIIESKQYADIYENWMLAVYPQNKTEQMPILINLETGEWTNNLLSSFALKSPAKHMLLALKMFYGNELHNIIYPRA